MKLCIKKEDIVYPNDFFKFNGVKLDDLEIEEMVNKTFQEVAKYDELYTTATGNTLVIGLPLEDEIVIYVAKNYEEFTVFRENIMIDGTK